MREAPLLPRLRGRGTTKWWRGRRRARRSVPRPLRRGAYPHRTTSPASRGRSFATKRKRPPPARATAFPAFRP
ncbi:hypothetical protein CFHF_09125 [Caulobacter flavus]|uniref:Uncharacterized protein n=1 Tax=Caulobacter flavus TaxID=1679497 RepID=A0A2N5CUX3_9CAUL|nr:hypothetical protein C1707_03410 [Caulobacter flavus]PLR17597.1 hypothetical protein CFHF_09125 [Caulobacter flavus]